MNRLINKLAGGEKAATPARRIFVIATLITALAVALSLITLGVTSLIFSLKDEPDDTKSPEEYEGGEDISPSPAKDIEYTTLEDYDAVKAKFEKLVDFKSSEDRTISGLGANNLYYAKNGISKLSSGTMAAVHSMLIDFYNANKASINTDIGSDKNSSDCTIPLLINSNEAGNSFELVVFGNNATTYNNKTYSWIYTNAAKYGFVTSENTFTYVGVAAASKGNTLSKLTSAVTATVDKVSYQVSFVSSDADEHKLPSNYEYTVYPYADGYVLTVNTSKKLAN